MPKKVNINDVARAAGVSKSTVSNYLNNRGRHFSDKTEAKIRQAISSLRYIPDPGARAIKSQEGGKSLGVVVRSSMDATVATAYYQQVLPAICDTLESHGYRTLIIPETRDSQRDITYMRELAKGLVAGYFIFNIDEADDPYVKALEMDDIKFLCVGYNRQIKNYVASRHDFGWEAAVNHLVTVHGARRIAAIPGNASHNVVIDRLKGYRDALSANALAHNDKLVFPSDYNGNDAASWLERRFSVKRPPDALILPHTLLQSATNLFNRLGLGIPDDVRLVVFDSLSGAGGNEYAHIQLKFSRIGREAATKMLLLLKNDPEGEGGLFLDVDFIPGASCGCEKI